MAREWEYRVEAMGGFFRSWAIELKIQQRLGQRADEGWELIGFTRSSFLGRFTLVFRRRVNAERDHRRSS